MEETKKKVNILAIVSASIAIVAGILGLLIGGVSIIGMVEGEGFLTLIGYTIYFFKDGGKEEILYGMLELMTLLATLLILAGGIVGLVGAITRKDNLLKVAKTLAVVAIPVGSAFYWIETFVWLGAARYFLTTNFVCWLLGLTFSITMIIANKKPKEVNA